MTPQNIVDRLPGNGIALTPTILTQYALPVIPAALADYVSASYDDGPIKQVTLTLTDLPITMTDDGSTGHGSVKLLDFAEGAFQPLGCSIVGTVALTTSWNPSVPVMGMGTAAAAADATLTGTEQDLLPSTLVTVASDAFTISKVVARATGLMDGTGTAKDVYLNFACTSDPSTGKTLTVSGTITITYLWFGDAVSAPSPVDFSGFVPGTETTGSMITTGSTWILHTAVGACAIKLLCESSALTGEYATLRVRAGSTPASQASGEIEGVNSSASARANDYGDLYGVFASAQPDAYTQASASNIVTALRAKITATAASLGRRWVGWFDTTATTKASGGDYLMRLSHNGTVANDGCWTIYGGGRLPLLFNIEDATPGFVGSVDGSGSYKYFDIKIDGTAYRIPARAVS